MYLMPALSTLFNASANENILNVHICTPSLKLAVLPLLAVVSLAAALLVLSVVVEEELLLLHDASANSIAGNKKPAIFFIAMMFLK